MIVSSQRYIVAGVCEHLVRDLPCLMSTKLCLSCSFSLLCFRLPPPPPTVLFVAVTFLIFSSLILHLYPNAQIMKETTTKNIIIIYIFKGFDNT